MRSLFSRIGFYGYKVPSNILWNISKCFYIKHTSKHTNNLSIFAISHLKNHDNIVGNYFLWWKVLVQCSCIWQEFTKFKSLSYQWKGPLYVGLSLLHETMPCLPWQSSLLYANSIRQLMIARMLRWSFLISWSVK